MSSYFISFIIVYFFQVPGPEFDLGILHFKLSTVMSPVQSLHQALDEIFI